ncbi:MAG TPA: hypothetical protein VEB43_00640 [Anaeromyxobacter sp.]|nr:hypothetical protein [Anaeromyxobacter sp.]
MHLAPLASILLVLFRHPLLLLALGFLVAVLLGAFRGIGLPRLFWHERPLHRFTAGAAATMLAAEVFLVAWLLDGGQGLRPAPLGLASYAAWATALWAGLLAACALVQVRRHAAAGRGAPAGAFRIAPGIARRGGPELVTARAPVGLFLAGAAAGGLLAWAGILALGPFADGWAAALARLVPRIAADPLAHLTALGSAVVMVALGALLRRVATPAVGVCFLLALAAAVHGFLQFWLESSGLAWLAVLAGLALGGRGLHKVRIRDLRALYRAPRPYPPPASAPPPTFAPLPWDHVCRTADPGRRPLVVVCASGGGLRAAAWTAGILGRLDELAGFRASTRLVTGSSGGMVGAAAWVAGLRAPAPPGWDVLCTAVGSLDALTDVARTLVFEDLPRAFWPGASAWNRGEALAAALEGRLRDRLGADLAAPFEALREAEERRALPSLVFSPMLVEDGRRLLLGNLDLSPATDNGVLWLSSAATGTRPVDGLASRTAYHASHLFPDRWHELRISTAARLSAAFPYVSPAAVLPTVSRRRVVDAGYFDEYGVDLACAWLRKLAEERRAWLAERVSGVLVLQIRDNVSNLSVNPETDADAERERARARTTALRRGLEGLTTPPEALLTARESVMLFRNDAQLAALRTIFDAAGLGRDTVKTTIFEFRGEASLSWTLSAEELDAIREQVLSRGIQEKLEAIALWLRAEEGRAPSVAAR